MANYIYVGDIGTVIKIDMETDISDATTITILVRKKGGDDSWTASLDSADDNVLTYTIVTDDLDVAGTYLLQPYFVTPSWTGKGKTVELEVLEAYK